MIQEVCKCEFCMKKIEELSFREHVLNCPMKPVECDNDCGIKMYQRDRSNHLTNDCIKRNVICQHCNELFIANLIDDHHEVCPKMKIKCPYDCDSSLVLRENLNSHLGVCTVLTKSCSFEYANCMFRGTDIALNKHMQECTAEHLQLLGKKLQQTTDILSQTVEKLTVTEKQLSELQNNFSLATRSSGGFVWKINNWASLIKANSYVPSTEFYTSHDGYKIKMEIYANGYGDGKGSHLSIRFLLILGKNDDQLNWPFRHKLTINLLNQIDFVNYTKTLDPTKPNLEVYKTSSGECFNRPRNPHSFNHYIDYYKFISHEQLNNGHYIKDDTVYFRLYVEDIGFDYEYQSAVNNCFGSLVAFIQAPSFRTVNHFDSFASNRRYL